MERMRVIRKFFFGNKITFTSKFWHLLIKILTSIPGWSHSPPQWCNGGKRLGMFTTWKKLQQNCIKKQMYYCLDGHQWFLFPSDQDGPDVWESGIFVFNFFFPIYSSPLLSWWKYNIGNDGVLKPMEWPFNTYACTIGLKSWLLCMTALDKMKSKKSDFNLILIFFLSLNTVSKSLFIMWPRKEIILFRVSSNPLI